MGIIPNVNPIIDQSIETVTDQMEKLNRVAAQYRTDLSSALSDMQNVQVKDVPAPGQLNLPQTPAPVISLDQQPQFQSTELKIPDVPTFHNIDDLISDLDLSDLDIPAAPEFPSIQMPEKPSFQAISAPDKPSVDFDLQMPEKPEFQLPEMAELIQLDIPQFQFEQLPDFDGKPPEIGSITVPNVFVEWDEPDYESEVLEKLQDKVKEWLSESSTGLSREVEDALFERARSRQSKETVRAVQEVRDDWAARNYTLPSGVIDKQIAAVREQGRLQVAELNRDIFIEAAKWEIENVRFAVQQGIAIEQLSFNIFSNTANRLFEIAKFNAESQMNVFNAQIAFFNAQNSAFEMQTQVYRVKLEGALAKLNAYKAAVDAQVAIGQINEQHVQVFRARMDAVLSNVDIYKSQVQAASSRADVMKNIFDAYRTEVQAFSEQISAEKLKVETYEAETRAETAKVSMFDSAARAYASTVQAVSAKADIKARELNLKMEAARTWISKYAADQDAFKSQVQASLSEVQANTQAYVAQVEAWKGSSDVNIAHAEMQSRYADMNTRSNISYAEMQIKQYEANIQKAIQEAQIALEAAKAMGQYTAQLAAGAMSAAHISASISGSGSVSASSSVSEGTSTSHNYSY